MLKILSKLSMLNTLQAAEFIGYYGVEIELQYRVEGSTAEYNIFLLEDKKIKPCAQFFGLAKVKTPYLFVTP